VDLSAGQQEILRPARTSLQSPVFNQPLQLLCFYFLGSSILPFIVKNKRDKKEDGEDSKIKLSRNEPGRQLEWTLKKSLAT